MTVKGRCTELDPGAVDSEGVRGCLRLRVFGYVCVRVCVSVEGQTNPLVPSPVKCPSSIYQGVDFWEVVEDGGRSSEGERWGRGCDRGRGLIKGPLLSVSSTLNHKKPYLSVKGLASRVPNDTSFLPKGGCKYPVSPPGDRSLHIDPHHPPVKRFPTRTS